ncbi:hypothetical protein BSE24067_07153 [Burkholderia seminalis]|nr:hypothetical protein BSE24067_07153 [Burkholderia seminalis]
MLRVEHVEVQRRLLLVPLQMRLVDERKARLIAGRVDDHVDRLLAAVGEYDAIALQFAHVGPRIEIAVAEAVEQRRIDDEMRFEQLVVGLAQSVVLRLPGRRQPQQPLAEEAARPQRHAQPQRPFGPLVRRYPEQEFRPVVVTAPRAVEHRARMMRRLDRDVAARIARADHEHAPVTKDLRRTVLRRMQLQPVEAARIVRQLRMRQMPVADDHAAIGAHFAAIQLDAPPRAAVDRRDLEHRAAELDPLVHAEAPRVRTQVRERLVAARIRRVVVGNRKIGVFREPLRADHVNRAIHRAARPAVVPVAADVVLALDHVEADPGREQVLRGGDSRRARADDAVPRAVVALRHGGSPLSVQRAGAAAACVPVAPASRASRRSAIDAPPRSAIAKRPSG